MQLCFCAASCNGMLLACVCCLGVTAEQYHARTCCLRVSLQLAQSVSENVVTYSTIFPQLHTSMRMVQNVPLCFAAIEIVAVYASNGEVPACRSGRSSLLNSLGIFRDLICMGSSLKCFVCVNALRTRVTWHCAVLIHSEITQVFQLSFTSLAHFMSRQFIAGDVVIKAQDTLVFVSNICKYRVFLTVASCEASGSTS